MSETNQEQSLDSSTQSRQQGLDDTETAAMAAAGTVIVFFVIYWALQVKAAYDLLVLAYG